MQSRNAFKEVTLNSLVMKISVIIPTYKPQDYLWECLDSLNIQTFPKEDFEVILVLNGCSAPYKSAIEKYIAEKMKDINVKFIHTEVGGVSNARNLALDQVRGEYVAFIDDDDLVSPKYLELLYEKADNDSISLSYPYAFNHGEINTQIPYHITNVYNEYKTRDNFKISSQVRKYFSGPCMKLIPMTIIKDRRFDVHFKNGEDTLFMFLISDRIKNICFAQEEAIYYRRYREGSAVMVVRKRKEIVKSNMLQIKTYIQYFIDKPFDYNWAFFSSRIMGAVIGLFK